MVDRAMMTLIGTMHQPINANRRRERERDRDREKHRKPEDDKKF